MKLAVTRHREKLEKLWQLTKDRQIELVPLPLTEIEPIEVDLPESFDLTGFDWIVFSSANGVSSFFDNMNRLGHELSPLTKLAVVGERTGACLTELSGRRPDFIPSSGYGRVMFEELVAMGELDGKRVLYARAELVNYDPGPLFKSVGVDYLSLVTYRSITGEVDLAVVDNLSENDYILFTSPSNVRAYENRFGRPVTGLIAMGQSTAKCMNDVGWSGFVTLNAMNVDTVLELI